MKAHDIFRRWLITICIAASCIATELSATAREEKDEALPSTVIRVKGPARYQQNGEESWFPLKRGQVLLPGTILQTAKGAQVDLVIGSKLTLPKKQDADSPASGIVITNGIRLLGDSVLALEQIQGRPASNTNAALVRVTELVLRSGGGIIGIAGKGNEETECRVRIAHAVFTVTEGGYFIDINGNCGTMNKSAILSFSNTKTYEVTPGNWFDVDDGEFKKWENRATPGDPFPTSPKQRD